MFLFWTDYSSLYWIVCLLKKAESKICVNLSFEKFWRDWGRKQNWKIKEILPNLFEVLFCGIFLSPCVLASWTRGIHNVDGHFSEHNLYLLGIVSVWCHTSQTESEAERKFTMRKCDGWTQELPEKYCSASEKTQKFWSKHIKLNWI